MVAGHEEATGYTLVGLMSHRVCAMVLITGICGNTYRGLRLSTEFVCTNWVLCRYRYRN